MLDLLTLEPNLVLHNGKHFHSLSPKENTPEILQIWHDYKPVALEYDSYAWPGGYPLYYIVQDDGILCPKCANDHISDCAIPVSDRYDQWRVVGCEINYEDDDLYCDHCNSKIESAYGED